MTQFTGPIGLSETEDAQEIRVKGSGFSFEFAVQTKGANVRLSSDQLVRTLLDMRSFDLICLNVIAVCRHQL
jgi:hypothetical protein